LGSRGQRLAQHLAAEQLGKAQILAGAAKQIFLDGFQAQQSHQFIQYLTHQGWVPRKAKKGKDSSGRHGPRFSSSDQARRAVASSASQGSASTSGVTVSLASRRSIGSTSRMPSSA